MPPPAFASDLLTAARDGDAAARGALLDRYRPYLALLAERLLGRKLRAKADPADLVQDAFLDACRGFHGFRGDTRAELTAWLRAILQARVRRLVRGYVAAGKRDVIREEGLAAWPADGSGPLDRGPADSGSSPSQRAGKREEAARLAAALARLAPDHREVIVLRVVDGLPFPEVAARMGRTAEAARKLLLRAVDRLQEVYGECDRWPGP